MNFMKWTFIEDRSQYKKLLFVHKLLRKPYLYYFPMDIVFLIVFPAIKRDTFWKSLQNQS